MIINSRPYLLVGAFLTAPFFLFAEEAQKQASLQQPSIQEMEWVRGYVREYPEISWLANDFVRKTEDGQAVAQGSYSAQLFGQQFIEFDRTLMTLRCLHWVLDGTETAYQEFTAAQPSEVKLSRESFKALHLQGMALLQSKYEGISEREMIQAMEAHLILRDVCKSEMARELFKPYGANAPDYDDFYGELIQILNRYPELCPTFDHLPTAAKRLLGQAAHLAHYGHIRSLAGGPNMFSGLKQSRIPETSPLVLLFDLFVNSCDVAGAMGHLNHQSSLVYTEQVHQVLQTVMDVCLILTDPEKTELDAYHAYFKAMGDRLGFDAQDRVDRALTRVGALTRLVASEEGSLLKQAFLQLDPEDQANIAEMFDAGIAEDFEHTPTYTGTVLVNLLNNPQLGATRNERLEQVVRQGLPFLSKVLTQHKQALDNGQADPSIPLNFNSAAGLAKASPEKLLGEFVVDAEGSVVLSRE